MNEILQVAMFAGQMILENGGETYRVEETIWRICKIYGADEAESFCNSNWNYGFYLPSRENLFFN